MCILIGVVIAAVTLARLGADYAERWELIGRFAEDLICSLALLAFLCFAGYVIVRSVSGRLVRRALLGVALFLLANHVVDLANKLQPDHPFWGRGSRIQAAIERGTEQVAIGLLVATLFFALVGATGARRRLAHEAAKLRSETEERRREAQRRERAERILQVLAEGISSSVGERFFESLVAALAKTASVPCVSISEFTVENPTAARTLAVWLDDELCENFEYELAGNPCGDVFVNRSPRRASIPAVVLPECDKITGRRFTEYFGLPLLDSSGQALGVIMLLSDRPIGDELVEVPALRVFAERAAAELHRKRMENEEQRFRGQVAEAQRLESLGVLAGGVAHDFNNLLTGVLGNTSLAMTRVSDDADLRNLLSRIDSSARRAADLCSQLLAYAGRRRSVTTTEDLRDVVLEMRGLLDVSIAKGAVLQFEFGGNALAVDIDVAQIRQLVLNLVVNASESLPSGGGTITVAARHHRTDPASLAGWHFGHELEHGDFIRVDVRDTGSGIDEAVRSRVFEPFFTTKPFSRGLGLSAALGIVRAHGGAIQVDSAVDEGTRFSVLLPVSSKIPATRCVSPSRPAEAPARPKLMVVDDEAVVRDLTRDVLETLGADVVLADSGEAALAAFASEKAAIAGVLLDLTMPGLESPETCRRLRELRPDLPVILMTGYASEEVKEDCADVGFSGFLPKPFDIEELVTALRSGGIPLTDGGGAVTDPAAES